MARPRKHQPDQQTRAMVMSLAGVRATDEYIAHKLGMGESQMRQAYEKELRIGRDEADLKVKMTAYKMAISGRQPVATFGWLERLCGWAVTVKQETTHNGTIKHDVSASATEDLERELEAIGARKTAAARARTVESKLPRKPGLVVH